MLRSANGGGTRTDSCARLSHWVCVEIVESLLPLVKRTASAIEKCEIADGHGTA